VAAKRTASPRRLATVSRRFSALEGTHPIFAAGSPVPALLQELPPELLEDLTKRQMADLMRAQAAWLRRLVTLDPRHARYSRQATAGELDLAIRLVRGLFSFADADDLTLGAVLRFAAYVLDTAQEARRWRTASPLPLPYIWRTGAELDDDEAADPFLGDEGA